MASVFTPAGKKVMLEHIAPLITAVSIHSADPGTTGTSELDGGDPAYARKAPDFSDTATDGEIPMDAPATFDIPAGSTVAYAGFWVGASLVAKAAMAVPETYANQGTFTLSAATKLRVVDPA